MQETTKRQMDGSYERRTKIVGVMGSGQDAHAELAQVVGRIVARLGCSILTGAGGGVMEAASRAFKEARKSDSKGVVIGVVKAGKVGDKDKGKKNDKKKKDDKRVYRMGKLNEHVEIPIFTHLPESSKSPASRNHINVLTSDALVFLPGGEGTRSELELAAEYDLVPMILFVGSETIDGRFSDKLKSKRAPAATIAKDEAALEAELRRVLELT